MCVRRGDSGDGVSLVKCLVASEDVIAEVFEIDCAFPQVGDFVGRFWQVFGGDNAFDTGVCFGAARVNGDNPRVRVWTAVNPAVQESRDLEIGTVEGTPGDFVYTVVPDGPGSDDFVFFLFGHCEFPSGARLKSAPTGERYRALCECPSDARLQSTTTGERRCAVGNRAYRLITLHRA